MWEDTESCSNLSNKTLIFIFPSFQLLNVLNIIFTSSLSEVKKMCKPHMGHARNKCRGINAFFSKDVALAAWFSNCISAKLLRASRGGVAITV